MANLSSLFASAPAPAPAAQPAPAPAPAAQPAPAPAPVATSSSLASILNAEVRRRGSDYFGEGLVAATVDRFKLINKDDGGQGLALEFTITQPLDGKHTAGTSWCLYRDIPGKHGMGASDVKTWITTILEGAAAERGATAPELDGPLLEQIVGEANPLAGLMIKVQGTNVAKKKGDGTFTRYYVEYLPAASQ